MENTDTQTPFGAGFSRGITGVCYQPRYECPQAEQKHQSGYSAGRDRYNRRFAEYKTTAQQSEVLE